MPYASNMHDGKLPLSETYHLKRGLSGCPADFACILHVRSENYVVSFWHISCRGSKSKEPWCFQYGSCRVKKRRRAACGGLLRSLTIRGKGVTPMSGYALYLTGVRLAAGITAGLLLFCCTAAAQEASTAPAGNAANAEQTVAVTMGAESAFAAFRAERWSPYICGLGIGLLCWLTFLLSDRPLGISTAYAKTAGMLDRLRRGDKVEQMEYYKKFPPKIGWEWMLVVGVIIGAFISALMSGSFEFAFLHDTWRTHVGDRYVLRWFTALAGGVLMGIGARWAGGCTSGHGISGTLQLAVSSWVVVIAMFAGAIVTAFMIM